MENTLTYNGNSWNDDKILSMSAKIDTSLTGRVLDVDTMDATISTKIRDRLYFVTADPLPLFTRDGLRFLTAAQYAALPTDVVQDEPVRFLRGGSQYALWYLARITRIAPDLYTLSMTSSLGRLTQMEHKGGIYNGVAASDIIDDICGVVPHFVAPEFANVLLYGWLPYVAPSGENGAQTGSAKNNLLQVLFALNATVRDDANGTLRIENLSTAVQSRIGAARIYRDNANVVTEPTVTAVTVLEHQYIARSETPTLLETTTLFEGTTVDGQVIVFREPMSNLTATGFTVTESNANYAVVSAGSGTLTGTPYIHTTREITKPVTAAAIPNAVRIEDATLVGFTNSSYVVNRLVDYYRHRTYINVDATIDFEDAGDVVEIYDPFDKLMRQACIEKISPLVVSQTMKGRISALVGFTPWQVVPFEDVRELITGSGTWTVPEGVTEITLILIGSGGGGQNGINGEDGTANSCYRLLLPQEGIRVEAGTGGSGGVGGVGGAPGKIFRVTIQVSPGQQFAYTMAAAGLHGPSPTDGGDSSFGTYSSANGAVSNVGYADPITGEVFALPGTNGIDGGDGGDGAPVRKAISSGEDGGDVGSFLGGNGGTGIYSQYTDGYYMSGGGGGSGAAEGTQGADGEDGKDYTRNGAYITFPGGSGADGADAIAPATPQTYGCGGNGGHGGGGGSGTGGFFTSQDSQVGKLYFTYIPTKGYGGAASTGTDGRAGCGILYYRRPVTE